MELSSGSGFDRIEHMESISVSMVNAGDQLSVNISIKMVPSSCMFGWKICSIKHKQSCSNLPNEKLPKF